MTACNALRQTGTAENYPRIDGKVTIDAGGYPSAGGALILRNCLAHLAGPV